MLEFFILFTITGFIIGYIQDNNEKAITIIIIISIIWLFIFGFWAFATLLELLLGYSLARKIKA